MSRFSLPLLGSVLLLMLGRASAQNPPTPVAVGGGVTDGMLTVSEARLIWEPFSNFPIDREDEYFFREAPKPPFALTLTARIGAEIPNRRGPRAKSYPGRVFLLTPDGGRISGYAVRDFSDGENVYKWVWNGRSAPDARAKTFDFAFDYSTAARPGTPIEKETIEWSEVSFDGPPGVATPLGAAKTEKTTPSGVRIWLDSVMVSEAKARPNGDKGAASVRIFGRWTPPASDPALRVTPELTREVGNRVPALVFDNGESQRANLSLGREVDRSDKTPGWLTVTAPLIEGARDLKLRVSLQTLSPLKTKPDVRSLGLSLPAPVLPSPNTENLPVPLAVQPLGKGQLQLFAPVFAPSNGWKWSWNAPLLLQMPDGADDGTRWQSTNVTFRSETGVSSTGLRSNIPWRVDNTPLRDDEISHQAVYQWSERPNVAPPSKVSIETRWSRVKTEVFTPRFADLPVPAPRQTLTPDLAQPLGEWGTLVLRKIVAFGPDDDLGPRFKTRAETFFPIGGLALVFEHLPAAGKAPEPWDLNRNYATWTMDLDEARDDQNYPLRRVTDAPDGRHLPAQDELAAPDEKSRRLTVYLLPPPPNAKSFGLTLRVQHQDVLENQTVTFPDVALPPALP